MHRGWRQSWPRGSRHAAATRCYCIRLIRRVGAVTFRSSSHGVVQVGKVVCTSMCAVWPPTCAAVCAVWLRPPGHGWGTCGAQPAEGGHPARVRGVQGAWGRKLAGSCARKNMVSWSAHGVSVPMPGLRELQVALRSVRLAVTGVWAKCGVAWVNCQWLANRRRWQLLRRGRTARTLPGCWRRTRSSRAGWRQRPSPRCPQVSA